MKRRDLFTGAIASILAAGMRMVRRRSPQPEPIPLRLDARDRHAYLWRVYHAQTHVEIGRDIPSRWAEKFARARLGEPFHFTVFKRDAKGQLMVGAAGIIQDRVRGVIVQKQT